MSWGRLLIVVLVGVGTWFGSTWAHTWSHPAGARAEQFRSIDQLPGMIDQDDTKVTISNIGTEALSILYLDGAWKTIQIPSRQYVTIPSQAGGLSVSFNDGVAKQSAVLSPGTAYALYFNAGLSRWAIAPYDDVAKRPSPLRSR
jgi:hypothetical protein